MPDADILIQHYLEGTLSSAEAGELHVLLQNNPLLGEKLLQHFEMDAMLRATKPLAAAGEGLRPTLLPKRRFTFATVSSVAALAACLVLAGTWVVLSLPKQAAEDFTASVAVLTRGVNLEWESAAITPGTPLSPGWLRLKSGIAQIEFYQGARVVMEGPAELRLVSSGEAVCNRGKLSAHVPPQAKGFRIQTPKGSIVDLGTEFGLEVRGDDAEVHVFKGEVELHSPSAPVIALKEGQAAALAEKRSATLVAKAANFVSLDEFDSRAESSNRAQFERWRVAAAKLDNDSALRLRFDFQDDDSHRVLRNHAPGGEDGSIVGASWTTGRWPGKGALEFRHISDRVRLSAPAEVKALTMAVWVRVNGLDRYFNSLFMSEGWSDRKIHWQIVRDGRIRLGIAGAPGKDPQDCDSEVFFTPDRLGRWTHLAVVFDPQARQVRHYANGEIIAQIPLQDASPLKPGIAELGNWNDRRTTGVAIRHLSGTMDEFALWDRVLSHEEIRAMMR